MTTTTEQAVRHGETLLDAVAAFRGDLLTLSSVERFVAKVETIGAELRASNVADMTVAHLHSVRVDEPRASRR